MRRWPLVSNWGGKHGEAVAAIQELSPSGYSLPGGCTDADPGHCRAVDHSPRQRPSGPVVLDGFRNPLCNPVHRRSPEGKKKGKKIRREELAREPAPGRFFLETLKSFAYRLKWTEIVKGGKCYGGFPP